MSTERIISSNLQPIAARCDGAGPHSGFEVRKYPMGDGNAILCKACAQREYDFDVSHGMAGRLWDDLKPYSA